MKELIESLKQRWSPENAIDAILETDLPLSPSQKKVFSKMSRSRSYMPTQFRSAQSKERQIKTATELFPEVPPPIDNTYYEAVSYLGRLKQSMSVKGNDFLRDRDAREGRDVKGLFHGHRAYNKRFRFLARFEEHLQSWGVSSVMCDLMQIAKSRLAVRIRPEMITDLATACFLAYMTAAMNRRSIFTFGRQKRAYDEVADLLFSKLKSDANWLAIAYVHPVPEVLEHLTHEEQGKLLGEWYNVMMTSAKILRELSDTVNLETMIVHRGNDSSTWNEAAGAYNKARDGWINTLYSMGAENLLETFAPPKALRLMAADVAWGHRVFGEGADPDNAVWNDLPKPWQVVVDGVPCARETIEAVCNHHQVEGRGWIAPRSKTVAAFSPTPELVHGVVISCPELALRLRKAGYFGGPSKKMPNEWIPIEKELDGLTVVVSDPEERERMIQEVDEFFDQFVNASQ